MDSGLNGYGMSSFIKRDQYPTQSAFTANQVADVFQNVSPTKGLDGFSLWNPLKMTKVITLGDFVNETPRNFGAALANYLPSYNWFDAGNKLPEFSVLDKSYARYSKSKCSWWLGRFSHH